MKKSNYFSERLERLLKGDIRRSKITQIRIKRGYKRAFQLIEDDIAKYITRISDDLKLDTKALNKKIPKEELLARAKELMLEEETMANYENLSYAEAIRREMVKNVESMAKDNESLIFENLFKTYEHNYYSASYLLYRTMDDFSFTKRVTKEYFDWMAKKPWTSDGKTFSDRIWKDQKTLVDELYKEFTVSATRGANLKETARRMSRKMDVSYKKCLRLLNTEDSFFSNKAVMDAYQNTTAEEYMILATLDRKTCEICGDQDNKHYKIKDAKVGVNMPPFHPNCRCTTVVYFGDEEDMPEERMMRDENGKSVKTEYMSYDEWKKKYVDKVDDSADIAKHDKKDFTQDIKPKLSDKEANEEKISKVKIDKPSQEELEAVDYYASGEGMYINDYLRDRNNPIERMGDMTDFDKEMVRQLEKATDREHGYNKLYRCVDADAIFDNVSDMDWEYIQENLGYGGNNPRAKEMIDSIKDKVITDKGFMSTTKDYDIAADFLDTTGANHPLVIEFENANKVGGFDLEKFMGDIELRKEQKEVILHNNASYKIKNIAMDKMGRVHLKADFIDVDKNGEIGYNINEINFKNNKLLESHFNKHKVEFENCKTSNDYLKLVNDFYKNENKDEVLGLTFLDGESVKYNIKTNEFMAISNNGKVKTYFKPKGGKDYYERTIRRKR
ncbi:minor capsid protein [uncultured Fenollaria sp.]|uniref:minor capsid protein n=1 Tax=uncultured Fenollaria sp. TaxID=1686315 RepID=UPI0025D5CDED|nr:minor capsid protein [uncultured Fenollaria sp.]